MSALTLSTVTLWKTRWNSRYGVVFIDKIDSDLGYTNIHNSQIAFNLDLLFVTGYQSSLKSSY